MDLMGIVIEPDTTWMKFTDLLVDSGVVSDCIKNCSPNDNVPMVCRE
jgi:hypothetical protein